MRRWDDEYVVHHALSNDTHRLAEPAGRMLEMLSMSESVSVDDLARDVRLEIPEIRATLLALEELGLVTQC